MRTPCDIGLSIVGAGDVLLRYAEGLTALHGESALRVRQLIDVRSPEAIGSALPINALLRDVPIVQLADPSPRGLVNLLREQRVDSTRHVVVIATPTGFHAPYACALMDDGWFVALEKPITDTADRLSVVNECVSRHGTDKLFLFGYYALEKALALRTLAAPGDVDDSYFDLLAPALSRGEWALLRQRLGEVLHIDAVILEAGARAGSLDNRPWVMAPEGGGNTLETFYHLVCLATAWLPGPWEADEVHLAVHAPTAARFRQQHGCDPAETLTSASLVQSGVPIRLVAAKYVSPDLHQRWMTIRSANGEAFADFETCTLHVTCRGESTHIRLRNPARYATQLTLLERKARGERVTTDFPLFGEALRRTLMIREVGLKRPRAFYESGELPATLLPVRIQRPGV